MTEEKYDSTEETMAHIRRVRYLAAELADMLRCQVETHDYSKLHPPEKQIVDEFTPKLKGLTYGSDEYKACLASMKPALDNHYATNSHHPEFYCGGVNAMDLLDLIEMFCDWKAATERHADGSFEKSISINAERFGISPQLESIFLNTKTLMHW